MNTEKPQRPQRTTADTAKNCLNYDSCDLSDDHDLSSNQTKFLNAFPKSHRDEALALYKKRDHPFALIVEPSPGQNHISRLFIRVTMVMELKIILL